MDRRKALAAGALLGVGLGTGTAVAAEGGFSPKDVADLGAPARDAVASNELPGVVSMVWRRGRIVLAETAGHRDLERKLPMQRDTIFGLASMTKPVTVAAALTLVDQGVIRLDDPITKWAPEFADMRVLRRPDGPLDDTTPAPRAITVEDLMSHRSGLAYGFMSPGPLGGALLQTLGFGIESPLTPDAWMKALAALPLAYAPGDRFNYGHSTDLLGFVIARAAGTSLREVMRRQLFGPLGMADTDFWIPPEKRGRAAVNYSSATPGKFAPAPIASWVAAAPPAYASGGQGLVSTPNDYLTFARMLLGGGEVNGRRVLRRETVRLMTSNRLTPEQRGATNLGPRFFASQGFGLGVSMITDPALSVAGFGRAGAFGWPGAFGGWWQADPAEDMVLLWLQQVLPAPPAPGTIPRLPGAAPTLAFQKAVYGALG